MRELALLPRQRAIQESLALSCSTDPVPLLSGQEWGGWQLAMHLRGKALYDLLPPGTVTPRADQLLIPGHASPLLSSALWPALTQTVHAPPRIASPLLVLLFS